jgi:hypothetical protein
MATSINLYKGYLGWKWSCFVVVWFKCVAKWKCQSQSVGLSQSSVGCLSVLSMFFVKLDADPANIPPLSAQEFFFSHGSREPCKRNRLPFLVITGFFLYDFSCLQSPFFLAKFESISEGRFPVSFGYTLLSG